MNNEDYIASGILELYATGALSEEEREEVELRAASSPEVRAALLEACAVVERYAQLYAIPPDPELKDRVMEQINRHHTAAPSEDGTPMRPVYTDFEKDSSPYKWMFAASVVLFLLSGFMSFRFYQNWQEAEQRLAIALASEQRLAQSFQTASGKLSEQTRLLSILRDGNFETVVLEGVAAHPDANVRVYWNPERRQVYLDVLRLPAPPAGKQYQLWALDQGKPVDAGVIPLNQEEKVIQQMKSVNAAQAFAITLEPVGGSENPTLDELYVMGRINS